MLLARISADLRCGPITALRRDSVLRVAPRPPRHSARARAAGRTRRRSGRGCDPARCASGGSGDPETEEARREASSRRAVVVPSVRAYRRDGGDGVRAECDGGRGEGRTWGDARRRRARPVRAFLPAGRTATTARASAGGVPDRRPKGARPKHRSRRDGKPRPPCSAEGEPGASIATAETAPAPDAVETIVPAETNASATAAAAAAAAASKPASKLPAGDDGPSARETATVAAFALLLAGAVASAGGPQGAADEITRAGRLLVENHIPGVGGIIEDSFLGLLVVCTVYSLWRSSLIPAPVGNPIARKSRTRASWLHVISGGGALVTGLYGVVLERVYRESPGWGWMWVSSALFLTNALTYSPLMQIFKASKEGKYAMKLGYSFVASFQGVVFIAWSA